MTDRPASGQPTPDEPMPDEPMADETMPDERVPDETVTRETMTGQAPTDPQATLPSAPAATEHGDVSRIVMYTTPWCGYCRRLKDQLARVGITLTEVDIEQDPHAAETVMRVNDGNQTVPTLVFADGSALTNPSVAEVTERLAAQR